ncbi:MAG: amine oxidase, partial [Candidatus Omnitrophota bacterium]
MLINTSPLDLFSAKVKSSKINSGKFYLAAKSLKHNSIWVVGIGLKKKVKTTKCWVYFPDPAIPFYRMTYFSHYSHYVVPEGDINQYSSLLCEVAFSGRKSISAAAVIKSSIDGLVKSGIISRQETKLIVSAFSKKIDYAYPIPTLDRDENLKTIQSFLEKNNIYSRGRFG